MSGPPREVAAVRVAVRADLRAVAAARPGGLVLVACSGGADSLALAAATAVEAPRLGLRAGAVTVDHGLHPGSAAVAAAVRRALVGLGLDPVVLTRVAVGRAGGPEAAARDARHAALARAAADLDAAAVLLGHTLDDQAETVLLGLARGSGARSLAGMPAVRGLLRRPLLGVERAVVRAACAAEVGDVVFEDPANADRALARARVRHDALPALEAALGPGVAAALARTARALRDDADALDALAADLDVWRAEGAGEGRSAAVADLTALPAALRRRALHRAALAAGCPAGTLAARHVDALDALLVDWRGQGEVHLPGGARGVRSCGRLRLWTQLTPGPTSTTSS